MKKEIKPFWYFCSKCGVPLRDFGTKEIKIECPECGHLMEVVPFDTVGYELLEEMTMCEKE